MRHHISMILLLSASIAAGCQRINYDSVSGATPDPGPAPGGSGPGPGPTGGTGGGGGPPPNVVDAAAGGKQDAAAGGKQDAAAPMADAANPSSARCVMVRAQARTILESNCAFCHQSPGNQANFDFILDLQRVLSAVATTGQ